MSKPKAESSRCTVKPCKWCKKDFTSWIYQNKSYCSNGCRGLGIRGVWPKSRDVSRTRITSQCQACGKSFANYPKRMEDSRGRYCSKECGKQAIIKHPRSFVCRMCGKLIFNRVGLAEIKFCSNGCQGKYYSGVNNPFWKGGRTSKNAIVRNSTKYKFWRKSVFERDNYTCV